MLLEQIIEFQLRGPGPPGRTCTPIIGVAKILDWGGPKPEIT